MKHLAIILGLLFSAASSANSVMLYDASSGLPQSQEWLFIGTGGSVSHDGARTTLDTTDNINNQAGFFSEAPFLGLDQHPSMPTLDRTTGFEISFELKVVSESHVSPNRAGFSVIVIGEDLQGIELGFFTDEVWAYDTGFVKAETAAYQTTVDTQYTLFGGASGYSLVADSTVSDAETILSGIWRDYNPTGLNALVDPYDNPSFLFFGDDTTSAQAEVMLGSIAVSTVPLPGGLLLLLSAFGALGLARFKRA